MNVRELLEALEDLNPETTVRMSDDSHSIVAKVELGTCYGCGRPEITLRRE